MHHVVLEHWSRGSSPIHVRDVRVKVLLTLGALVAVATTNPVRPAAAAAYLGLLVAAALLARLPLTGVLARAAIVLPFSATFALLSYLLGDPDRAVSVLVKSYISAVAVLVLAGTTPLPRLLHGLERMGAPRMLVQVLQFLYRYLFVISEQAQHMRLAAGCRGGAAGLRSRFQAAAGALATLFGKSYARAEGIHRAMLARGFRQHLELVHELSFTFSDAVFLLLAGGAIVAIRLALGAG